MKEHLLSVIIPAFNEQDMIEKTFLTVKEILNSAQIPFELLYIDDGSGDLTYSKIHELSLKNPEIVGLSFSRNFGKEAAIFAGIESARGDCCVIMDCDLQHPPMVIPQMYSLWEQGYEVVEGVKASRGKENFLHTLSAKGFYHLISKATQIDMSRASDFKLLDRRAMEALLLMPERTPFFRALSSWIGFKTTSIEFEVQERTVGSSKWSPFALIKYAIQNITSFSAAPLHFVSLMGWLMLVFAIILIIQSLYRYFTGTALEGFTTVILLQLFIGSLLMISLGIIGHYISRIYNEIKARPRFIISHRCGTGRQNEN